MIFQNSYMEIQGKHHFVFFFISTQSLKITAYHLTHNKDVPLATIALTEAFPAAHPNQKLSVIISGNPSFAAAI
jgi:hypothetical protein